MSTTTTNLGLIKPERSDNYSVDVMGENMDIIDERITALEKTIPEEGVFSGDTVTAEVGKFDKLYIPASSVSATANMGLKVGTANIPATTIVSQNGQTVVSDANTPFTRTATVIVSSSSKDLVTFDSFSGTVSVTIMCVSSIWDTSFSFNVNGVDYNVGKITGGGHGNSGSKSITVPLNFGENTIIATCTPNVTYPYCSATIAETVQDLYI